MNKSITKCEMAEDIKDGPITYYNVNRKKKRSWKYCPRCNAKAVDRIYRKCMACGGRLHFQGDDCHQSNENMDYWFMFMTDSYGTTGWYSKDYFVGEFNKSHQQ